MIRVLLVCIAALISSNLRAQISDSIFWDGNQRTYKFFLPTSYTGSQNIPMIISLHPSFSNADNHMNAAKWQLFGDTANFISVYPNGTSNQQGSTNFSWNAYNLSTGSSADDVGFLNALLDSMITNYAVDTCRIYISGFSNGAWMSWRMICDFTNRFAAVAPLSGSWKYGRDGFCDHGGCDGSTIPGTNPPSQEATLNCTPSKRIPYMYYRGTNEVNLTDRAITDPNGNYFWSRHNGCDTIATVDT
ncbi:MAG: alpha/beta hydrolase family esterase, partial [Bacteroidota bacterium]